MKFLKRVQINGYTGKSRILVYPDGQNYLITPERDRKEYLNIINVSDPEEAEIILKWDDQKIN